MSDIAAQDRIIYVWDVQWCWRAIKAEKERKKRLAIEAALASRASSSLKIVKLICLQMIETYWFQELFNLLVLQRQQQHKRFPCTVEILFEL